MKILYFAFLTKYDFQKKKSKKITAPWGEDGIF